ncbi:MAG: hypothetical protein LBJ72_10635 [Dysgonamonadaceae bacterium]|jgi:hypothetical protein|nr:hypothetical protein [Dysgonamonadaceae bacterium]
MDTTFNIFRFGKLITNEYNVNFKKIILSLGMLLGIAFLFFGIAVISRVPVYLRFASVFFFLVILVFQGYVTGICFSEFSSKPGTLSFFLIPASKLEKFLAKISYCLIIFPLIFLLYHFLVMKMSVAYNSWATETFNLGNDAFSDGITYDTDSIIAKFLIWFLVATTFLCGALFFKKHFRAKTFLALLSAFILMGVLSPVFYFFVSGHMPSMSMPFLMTMESLNNGKEVYAYLLIENYPYCIYGLKLFIGLYLMLVSWVKFNEKTI